MSVLHAVDPFPGADAPDLAPATLHERFRDLERRAADLARAYQAARPFPFLVLDDFLPTDLAGRLEADFPGPEADVWHRYPGSDQHNKLALRDDHCLTGPTRALVHELNSGWFLDVLERITGIGNLVADARLVGGGLHQTLPGGRLDMHVDYSHHPGNRLNRRLNLILYLNRDWEDAYGGHFELWDRELKQCEHRIAPVFNRCVLFSTTRFSYHGHPDPLACPAGRSRKSIALYYYSNGRPEEPGEVVEHNTLFRRRPGDPFSLSSSLMRLASSGLVRDLMPPLVYRWLRRTWNQGVRKSARGG